MRNLKIRIACPLFTLLFLFSSLTSPVLALINYSYDANGNMVSDGERCYTYNDANQVSKVKKCSSDQLIAEYLYDYTGKRIVKKEYENGILKQTIYSPDKSFETKKLQDNSTQNTSYYFANDEIVARKNPDSSKVFYHNDYLTSTNVLTEGSGSGSLVEETTYYPYGDIRSGGTKSKYLYTGQEKDTDTGLNYYGARYYNSHIRRFTQPDLTLPDPYDPQQLNRYAYVRNNPLKYVDPSGNNPLLIIAAVIAAGYIYQQSAQPAYAPASVNNLQQLHANDIAAHSSNNDLLGGNSIWRSANTLNSPNSSITDVLNAGASIIGHQLKNSLLLYTALGETYLAGKAFQEFNSSGKLTDLAKRESDSSEYISKNPQTGWYIGDPLNNYTSQGKAPSWQTTQSRFWKNDAFYHLNYWEAGDIERMKVGLAPLRENSFGILEPLELHHVPAQRDGGLFNFDVATHEYHINIDKFRF